MDGQAFQLLMNKLEDHDKKLDALIAWKWKLAGVALTLNVICGVALQYIMAKVGK